MDEALYRQNQATKRLFGPSATLAGSIGSGRAPGHIEIKCGGKTLGSGRSFEQALQDVTTRGRESTPCR